MRHTTEQQLGSLGGGQSPLPSYMGIWVCWVGVGFGCPACITCLCTARAWPRRVRHSFVRNHEQAVDAWRYPSRHCRAAAGWLQVAAQPAPFEHLGLAALPALRNAPHLLNRASPRPTPHALSPRQAWATRAALTSAWRRPGACRRRGRRCDALRGAPLLLAAACCRSFWCCSAIVQWVGEKGGAARGVPDGALMVLRPVIEGGGAGRGGGCGGGEGDEVVRGLVC